MPTMPTTSSTTTPPISTSAPPTFTTLPDPLQQATLDLLNDKDILPLATAAQIYRKNYLPLLLEPKVIESAHPGLLQYTRTLIEVPAEGGGEATQLLPAISSVTFHVDQRSEQSLEKETIPWLKQLKHLTSLEIGEFARVMILRGGGKKKEEEEGHEDDNEHTARGITYGEMKKKKKQAEMGQAAEEDEEGEGEGDDWHGLQGEPPIPPTDWQWLVRLGDLLSEEELWPHLTLSVWMSKAIADGHRVMEINAPSIEILTNFLSQLPSTLERLRLGTHFETETYVRVLPFLTGPSWGHGRHLKVLTVGGDIDIRAIKALTESLEEVGPTGVFASSIEELSLGRACVSRWPIPLTESQKARMMDDHLKGPIFALRHCTHLRKLYLGPDLTGVDFGQLEGEDEALSFCSLEPYYAIFDNVIKGYWPSYAELPTFSTFPFGPPFLTGFDVYVTRLGQALALGRFQECQYLITGARALAPEGLVSASLFATQCLGRIPSTSVFTRLVRIEVPLVDESKKGKGTQQVWQQLASLLAGGQFPVLEKVRLICGGTAVESEEEEEEEGGNNGWSQHFARLIRASMAHPTLRKLEVLWIHDGKWVSSSTEEEEAQSTSSGSSADEGEEEEEASDPQTFQEFMAGDTVRSMPIFAQTLAEDLLEGPCARWSKWGYCLGYPSVPVGAFFFFTQACTLELVVASHSRPKVGEFETYLRFTQHGRLVPPFHEARRDGGREEDWDFTAMPLPYANVSWHNEKPKPGEGYWFVSDSRFVRLRADAPGGKGGKILGCSFGFGK